MDISVDDDRVVRAFRKYERDVSDLAAAWRDIGAEIKQDAIANVPVVSGDLARSIRSGTAARFAAVRAGGTKVPYAETINSGGWATGDRPPHYIEPTYFLTDALASNEDMAVSRVLEEIRRLAGRAGW